MVKFCLVDCFVITNIMLFWREVPHLSHLYSRMHCRSLQNIKHWVISSLLPKLCMFLVWQRNGFSNLLLANVCTTNACWSNTSSCQKLWLDDPSWDWVLCTRLKNLQMWIFSGQDLSLKHAAKHFVQFSPFAFISWSPLMLSNQTLPSSSPTSNFLCVQGRILFYPSVNLHQSCVNQAAHVLNCLCPYRVPYFACFLNKKFLYPT